MLGNLSTNDNTTFDPRRQPSSSNTDYDNNNSKGSRPPPGIDI